MSWPLFNVASLEARVRSRADMVGSLFVTSTEILTWLEAAWQELYGTLSAQYDDLLVTQQDVIAAQGTGKLGIPYDVKRLRGVRIKDDDFLTPLSLREIQALDRPGRQGVPVYYWYSTTASTAANGLLILPYCNRQYTFTLYYQPALALGDIEAFGSLANLASWDEYIVLSAAIKCKDKEESSVSVLVGERTALLETIKSTFTPNDTSEAGRVTQIAGRVGRAYGGSMRSYDYQGPDDDY